MQRILPIARALRAQTRPFLSSQQRTRRQHQHPHPGLRAASSFQQQPAPPRLPEEQQAEFERLQRGAEAPAFIPPSSLSLSSPALSTSLSPSQTPDSSDSDSDSDAEGATTLSGGMRQGAAPEFAGEKNPRTGEVGGPKNEPLRWGSAGDWSYNGRVTDF